MNKFDFWAWMEEKSKPRTICKPLVMGILNITPDSFSDGGKYFTVEQAYEQAMSMVLQGVDLIDIGGESSRPGASAISVQAELDRVMPVIERVHAADQICISIDTYKPAVMHQAVLAGAGMINDIYALRYPDALSMASQLNVPVCLMHMQGNPETMQQNPTYSKNIMDDMHAFFSERIDTCIASGLLSKNLLVDPGFGFGKNIEHNKEIIAHLSSYKRYGMPILLGVSRKKTLGTWVGDTSLSARRTGGLTLGVYALLQGVSIIRTHDVLDTVHAVNLLNAVIRGASS